MSSFDFSNFPTLTTRRLNLRQLEPEDARDVFTFRSDPEVQKYNGVPMSDLEEVHWMLQFDRDQFAARQGIMWALALRLERKVIGLVSLTVEAFHNRASLGFDTARDYWRQGYTTEALEAVLSFGFEQMALNRIEAETIVDNAAAVHVLEKLGFKREGVRRAYSLEDDGLYHDDAIYALLRSEYARG